MSLVDYLWHIYFIARKELRFVKTDVLSNLFSNTFSCPITYVPVLFYVCPKCDIGVTTKFMYDCCKKNMYGFHKLTQFSLWFAYLKYKVTNEIQADW